MDHPSRHLSIEFFYIYFFLKQRKLQSWASPQVSAQVHNCGLAKKVADMRICGLWQFKLRACSCGLFFILIRNSASFIQTLKLLSIFVKYSCFYPVEHENSIQCFQVQVRQKKQVFRVQADKNTESAL